MSSESEWVPLSSVADEPLPTVRSDPTVVYALIALTAFLAVVGLAGLIAGLVLISTQSDVSSVWKVVAVISPLTVSLAACGLLLGHIAVIRRLDRVSRHTAEVEQRTALLAEQAAALSRPAAAPGAAIDPQALYRVLAQIEETLLLPDEQRERRYAARVAAESQKRLADTEQFITSKDFHRAREQLATLATRFGANEQIKAAEARLEQAAQKAQVQDIEDTRNQLRELMSAGQWDKSEQLARELADKYPTATEPLGFIEMVCRERQVFEQRHRLRLHEEIQRFVHERRWQEAAQAARTFVTTFPIGQDSEALRTQLDTLEANAEIQTRQQLEHLIKERIREHRYWDAVDVARRLIMDYPFSPQANALRSQLPRLEELARTQQA